MYNILMCDDEKEIVEAVSIYLEAEGYKVFKAYDGSEALEIIANEKIHLLVVDIMMPKVDGLNVVKKIREFSNVPVILLSARTEYNDKILGLNVGADDYMAKPFNPLELVARVKSQLRRYTTLGNIAVPSADADKLISGGLVLDTRSRTVAVDGEDVKLTPIEFHILRFLMENMNTVFSTSQIYEAVWKEEAFASENIIAVHIRHIREKIELNPKEPKYLKVVWGQGYKLEKI
ncbi:MULTISPECIES: response regulator transcription factor [Eubacterium]|jgi:DNA-binding response OmpR family regulator|uniref:Stage 0 sporulation protein A homolog n=1 Tax=Eubacterium ruminantium TaxID=42322 RepID=A0A1T4K2L2_9FIRM|nr:MULTISPECIES: response regulator transcription factor [Eubacterium]MCR5368419.1 response regulator transcription factor [Eubacterium sp.]SCW28123.1 DNA-binding response regulator, OmpR family, contains REC and winged-helix (wHTH) domain [Eubacterium ruminantium]SDM12558.1 DNA-binding response regulator, OmpR family, contains REC and winged-helix (wHTH) domain [Eubacterium ruminantium]SJZ36619.1 DNA-binding response regulator, OmpR family, contains REC and winged-helix (wHTH) domain [Eubacter